MIGTILLVLASVTIGAVIGFIVSALCVAAGSGMEDEND